MDIDMPDGLAENPGALVVGPKHEYYKEFGGHAVWSVCPETGQKDLIYDPSDPAQIAPYGCSLNAANAIPGRRAALAPPWQAPAMMMGQDLPDVFIMGPKALGGGLGKGIVGTCLQRIGDCVAACGSNVVEGTMRSEEVLLGKTLYHPEVSITHLYYGAQTALGGRPGGDGAFTQGLAMTLQGFDQKRWANAGGRYGGVVHEAPCEAVTDPDTASGFAYDPMGERAGKAVPDKWIVFGLQHLCSSGSGDIRSITDGDFGKAQQVWASGHILFSGIQYPSNWSKCDKNGFVLGALSNGPGGHEMLSCGYLLRKAQSGYGGSNTQAMQLTGGTGIWVNIGNSWGIDFGCEGHILVPQPQFLRVNFLNEAYTISYVNGWDKSVLLDWSKGFV